MVSGRRRFFRSRPQCRRLETRVSAGDGRSFDQPCVREFGFVPRRIHRPAHGLRQPAKPYGTGGQRHVERNDFPAGQAGDSIRAIRHQSFRRRGSRSQFHAGTIFGIGREKPGSLVALHDGHAGALRSSTGVCAERNAFGQFPPSLRHPQNHTVRDNDEHFPDIGKGGNFYLQVNGRDFLVRGGDYTADLLYRYDPKREEDILRYAKDLGINFLRWESKISSEHIVELADERAFRSCSAGCVATSGKSGVNGARKTGASRRRVCVRKS